MDRHVERIERLLGRQSVGQIHWVRGTLLGRSGVEFWGVALGSKGAERIQSSDGRFWERVTGLPSVVNVADYGVIGVAPRTPGRDRH